MAAYRNLHSFPTRRSSDLAGLIKKAQLHVEALVEVGAPVSGGGELAVLHLHVAKPPLEPGGGLRSEEHTSELQSRPHLVCRLLLEKKNRSVWWCLVLLL